MRFVLLYNTHFKRKRSHKIERSLDCTEWKSAFMSILMSHALVDFFVSSFVLPCAYAYVAIEDQAEAAEDL